MGFDIESIPHLYIPMPEFDLTEYTATGLYNYVQPIISSPIKEESVHYEWRHLGNFQSNAGSSDELQHQIDDIINKNLRYMCSKKITPDAALQGYSLKILKQLLYKPSTEI